MSLLSQPTELLVAQMLLLDEESLVPFSEAHPNIKEIYDSDWFWRRRIEERYPGFTRVEGEEDHQSRELYQCLSKLHLSVEKDLVSPLAHLDGKGDRPLFTWMKMAVAFSSLKVLRWLLQNDQYRSGEVVFSDAVKRGSVEMLKVFIEEGCEVTPYILAIAAVSGRPEIFKFLMTDGSEVPLFPFLDEEGVLIDFLRDNGERREGFIVIIRWMDKIGLFSERQEQDIALVLEEFDRFMNSDDTLSDVTVDYAFEYSSEEFILELSRRGFGLRYIHNIPSERLKYLFSLGVRIDDIALMNNEEYTEGFLKIVDTRRANDNLAVALAYNNEELLSELQKRELTVTKEGLRKHLRSQGEEDDEKIEELFRLFQR